jgi:hypothetical protein
MSTDGVVENKPALKAKRPRPDGLTYSQAELAWALGISIRQLRRNQWKLPKSLDALSRQPRWSREEIRIWVEGGCKPRH